MKKSEIKQMIREEVEKLNEARNRLQELNNDYGSGITFVDIDETIFHTYAMINVIDDETEDVIDRLTNQDYNTYKLKSGTHFQYDEFRNAKLFKDTSVPIMPTIKRIKKIIRGIDNRDSKIVLLTARKRFEDLNVFLGTFEKYGISTKKLDIQFAGDINAKTVASAKKKIITQYLSTGKYRRVRLLDDDSKNIQMFVNYGKNIPNEIVNKIKQKYNIPDNERLSIIEFYALHVQPDGSLRRVN